MSDLPKVWLAHSYTLNKNFLPDFKQEEFERKLEKVKIFSAYIDKHVDFILEKIVHYTGLAWQSKEIPVYILFDHEKRSIAFPLIIAWKGYPEDRLLVLTHELIHIILRDSQDNIFKQNNPMTPLNNKESEAVIWLIVKQVFTDLDQARKTKFTDEYDRFSQFDEAQKEFFKLVNDFSAKWDIKQKPLKEWLQTL
ncbi:hypothetical protein COT44_03220 [Candidatus Shapirobacteria bacterium CG08_land_8_20_14_0_20_39_18]|uniref:Uncharacterized protein n=1 Tax=Candidatus Shapirobacteria bacterium CG08_land_8_20_14_0_20_39_18 TaxID=1974883 RepID=A0A2M6XCL9_9BACT|nr:MAG: hypothetical protein COT44_03220 [Candidatus Shapirobacteria bacterium CG08_land_8_20_14_0_20_39_18]PIY65070.1 MAG: hypothetical protein COY91_03330 [Candidatus Shapirobacteria bacterium CG_4_10_14_0_8_um_filter_39_15]